MLIKNVPLLFFILFQISFVYGASYEAEGWDQLISKYAPVVYLHEEEKAFPVAVEEYFLHPKTSLRRENGDVLLPQGEVTMRRIYEMSLREKKRKNDFYFNVPPAVYQASNNDKYIDSRGQFFAPVYIIACHELKDEEEKIYFTYVFFYPYNPPYNLSILNQILSKTKRGEHIADVEHVTVEVDAKSKTIDRIFLAAHGKEGVWFPADHEFLSYEQGHPVVYSAKGSHASYAREGIYIRGHGVVNDRTSKGIRWMPKIVPIFFEEDSRFDPAIMGWVYHRGTYAKDHVDAVCLRDWFGRPSEETGREIKDILFCESDAIWDRIKKTIIAYPP